MMVFGACGINWQWYLECEIHENGFATIHAHYRLHLGRDHNHPKVIGSFRIVESKPVFRGPYHPWYRPVESTRTAVAIKVWIDGIEAIYPVDNPKHVFSYSKSN